MSVGGRIWIRFGVHDGRTGHGNSIFFCHGQRFVFVQCQVVSRADSGGYLEQLFGFCGSIFTTL